MKKEYYPIGTVVTLKQAPKVLFMIVGLEVQSERGECRDYVAVRYPVGEMDNKNRYFFNCSQIEKVVHMGYVNIDHETYVELLNCVMEKRKQMENEEKA